MAMDRRSVLRAICALAVLPTGSGAQPAAAPARLGRMAAVLTGYADLDADAAAQVLQAFAPRAADLQRLADVVASASPDGLDQAIAAAGLGGLADALVQAWYAGTVAGPGGSTRVVLYPDALAWRALSFTKPMGLCGGETGYWSRPAQVQ